MNKQEAAVRSPQRHRSLLLALIAGATLLLLAAAARPAPAADAWSDPTVLSDASRTALGVAIADGAQASPFAAWHETDGTSTWVYAARFIRGGWSAPVRLSQGPVVGGTVRIAANRSGGAVVTWQAQDGIFAARFANGAWSTPIRIAGDGAETARVMVGRGGMATVVWTERDAVGTRRVRATRFGGTIPSPAVWVSPAGEPVAPVLYVAKSGYGTPYVTWQTQGSGRSLIQVASFERGVWKDRATWSDPSRNAALPRIAAAVDGDVAVTWVEQVGANRWRPMARILDSGVLARAEVLGPASARIPQITVAASGAERVAVAWTALDGDTTKVHATLHDPYGWGEPLVIDEADSPQAAMDADGRAILAYRILRDGPDDIVARTGKDRAWSDATRKGITTSIYGPRIAVGPGGATTAIWTTPDPSGSGADVAVAARDSSHLRPSATPYLDAVVGAIRAMEQRTRSDSSETVLWEKTTGNALDGAGTADPAWLVRTQDCWGRTDSCSSAAAQQRMLTTIRSIIANAETTVDVSSLAGVADGGFREALIEGAREADAAGRRPVIRMLWGHQPAAPFSKSKLRKLQADVQGAAPNLKVVLALHTNRLVLNGYSWNHSKIVAADGRVAYVAGINMWSDSYLQSNNPVTDVGVVVRGPGAASAHRFLDVIWTEVCRYPKPTLLYANTLVPESGGRGGCPARRGQSPGPAVGNVPVLAVSRAGYSDTGRPTGKIKVREVSAADRRDSGCIVPPLPNPMNGNAAWDGNNPSDTALRALVETATDRIVIGQQEATFSCAVLPSYDVRLFDALARKVADGVSVTIVVSNENGAISLLEGYSAKPPDTLKVLKARLAKLLGSKEAATRAACESLTVARFRYSDNPTWPNGKEPALHGKVIAVDDEAFYVGSQNAYPNQLQEFGFIIEDPTAMADFKRDYLDPMVRYSSRAALPCS